MTESEKKLLKEKEGKVRPRNLSIVGKQLIRYVGRFFSGKILFHLG
jgi:hypothetical protein